jgi:hypothetical protein
MNTNESSDKKGIQLTKAGLRESIKNGKAK